MRHDYVEYKHAGVSCRDSYYVPEDARGPLPIVIVIPDYHGATEYAEASAEVLCELGYVGYAVDFYGGRAMPKTSAEAAEMIIPYFDDRTKALDRGVAALERARGLDFVDASKTAAIGYSSGGMYAIDLARRVADLGGAISVWGLLLPWQLRPLLMNEPSVSGPKILAVQGTIDPFAPIEDITGFVHEMNDAGADFQLHLLGGVKHAFSLKTEHNLEIQSGEQPEALLYDAAADERARVLVREFLAEIFA